MYLKYKIKFILLLSFIFFLWQVAPAECRSALSPRHSGMDPPGGPRPLEAIPARPLARTPSGGMGYTDAYGNAVEDVPPQERKTRPRPGPGAFGSYGEKDLQRPLPDPNAGNARPLWKFE